MFNITDEAQIYGADLFARIFQIIKISLINKRIKAFVFKFKIGFA
jgi:hypothetical protein